MKLKNICLVFSVMGLFGCNYLDEIPERDLVTDNAFLTPKQFDAPINGLYQNIRVMYNSNDYYPDWVFHGLGADSWSVGGDQGGGYALKPYNNWKLIDAYNGEISRFYNRNYSQISQCNILLDKIENPDVTWDTEDDKNKKKAEILFFRAYAYRLLGHAFGGVPIVTEATTTPRFDYVRASRKEVYEQAIADAEFASMYLPKEPSQPGRVVKATADHLLAELYIALSDNGGDDSKQLLEKSISYASKVIGGEDGDFHLMKERFGKRKDVEGKDVYWDLFRMGNHNRQDGNMESLWVIQFERNSDGSFPNGGVPNWGRPLYEHSFWPDNYKWEAKKFGYNEEYFSEYGGGEGQIPPTNYIKYYIWKNAGNDIRNAEHNIQRTFYAAYHVKDGKLDKEDKTPFPAVDIQLSEQNGGGTVNTGPIIPGQKLERKWITNTEIDTMRCFYPKIWKFGSDPDEHINQEPDRGFVPDIYVFRLAETFLLRAEAYLKLGDKSKAAEDINQVRERAKAPLVKAENVSIDYILDERARELMGEELRSLTLMRLDKFVEYTKKYGYEMSAKTIEEKNNLYPIPQGVIDANKDCPMENNPGW